MISLKYIAGYIFSMATLCADVTKQMTKWVDEKVEKGLYKSRSEVVRSLLREKIEKDSYPKAALSEKALKNIWNNAEDEVWAEYL